MVRGLVLGGEPAEHRAKAGGERHLVEVVEGLASRPEEEDLASEEGCLRPCFSSLAADP